MQFERTQVLVDEPRGRGHALRREGAHDVDADETGLWRVRASLRTPGGSSSRGDGRPSPIRPTEVAVEGQRLTIMVARAPPEDAAPRPPRSPGAPRHAQLGDAGSIGAGDRQHHRRRVGEVLDELNRTGAIGQVGDRIERAAMSSNSLPRSFTASQ